MPSSVINLSVTKFRPGQQTITFASTIFMTADGLLSKVKRDRQSAISMNLAEAACALITLHSLLIRSELLDLFSLILFAIRIKYQVSNFAAVIFDEFHFDADIGNRKVGFGIGNEFFFRLAIWLAVESVALLSDRQCAERRFILADIRVINFRIDLYFC